VTGQRQAAWSRNVITLGLASGFLEPLESTSLHLVQSGITKLLAWFPDRDFDPRVTAEYNRQVSREFASVRDFLVLHYQATEREGSFWQACRDMEIPDALAEKVEMFRHSGRLIEREKDLFHEASWLAVMLGQGVNPERYDTLADVIAPKETRAVLSGMRKVIADTAAAMPGHAQFIARHCRAVPPVGH
jgi:tryptophan halogenase